MAHLPLSHWTVSSLTSRPRSLLNYQRTNGWSRKIHDSLSYSPVSSRLHLLFTTKAILTSLFFTKHVIFLHFFTDFLFALSLEGEYCGIRRKSSCCTQSPPLAVALQQAVQPALRLPSAHAPPSSLHTRCTFRSAIRCRSFLFPEHKRSC